ncbi:hypothetical protein Syun_012419 [Stephania yunnanensis]|uniref:Uncharacterized protein n=1 Tax=Stephania yunnanensis TaxID=152371 RepID=A0AAP0PHH7_9MAGN
MMMKTTKINSGSSGSANVHRFAGKGNQRKFVNKDDMFCDHCKAKRHTKETCFKLHGFPDWYKKDLDKKQMSNNSKSFVNLMESPLDVQDAGSPQFEDFQSNIAAMIQQGIENFMKGKSVSDAGASTHVNSAISDFTGSSYKIFSSSCSSFNSDAWIVDSGATNHMCTSYDLLANVTVLTKPVMVCLPDGLLKRLIALEM